MQFKLRRVQRTSYCIGRRNECEEYDTECKPIVILAGYFNLTEQENKLLKSDIKKYWNKKIWLKIYKNQTKDRNIITAIINTSAPSLGEEGTRNIEDLKRQMVLMEEENKNAIQKRKRKNIFQRRLPTSLLKRNDS